MKACCLHSHIILSDSPFKKGVPLASLGLVSQTILVLLGVTFSTELKYHWDTHCHPGLTHPASLPGWSVFSRPNSSSSSISSPSITSETDFPSFCNWIASVTWNNSLSSKVSQIQLQLPDKTILCPEVRQHELKGSQTTRSPSNTCSAEPKPVGPSSTSCLLFPSSFSPHFSKVCAKFLLVLSYLKTWMFENIYLNVQRRTTIPQYAQFSPKLRSLH